MVAFEIDEEFFRIGQKRQVTNGKSKDHRNSSDRQEPKPEMLGKLIFHSVLEQIT
jgi:hypothetical protein